LAILKRSFVELDGLVVQARLVMLGDQGALAECRRWLAERAPAAREWVEAADAPDLPDPPDPPGGIGMHEHGGPSPGVGTWVNGQPVLDLLIGIAFSGLADDGLRKSYLDTVNGELGSCFGVLDGLQGGAIDFLEGTAGPGPLLELLDRLG